MGRSGHEQAGDDRGAGLGMPPLARRLGRVALGLAMAGALYLIVVRREAILTDLAGLAAWCF